VQVTETEARSRAAVESASTTAATDAACKMLDCHDNADDDDDDDDDYHKNNKK